jgi:hypothetical protein
VTQAVEKACSLEFKAMIASLREHLPLHGKDAARHLGSKLVISGEVYCSTGLGCVKTEKVR